MFQLFGGAFQFCVPLSDDYGGRKIAALAFLDVVTFREEFREISSLELPEAPRYVSQLEVETYFKSWGDYLNAQVHAAFGKNVLLLNASSKQSYAGAFISVPLLWVEHEVKISVSVKLVPDRTPAGDVQVPNDPRLWVISTDFGKTKLGIFETFAKSWNEGAIDRTVGPLHVYIPPELKPGVRLLFTEDFSCPITEMKISYEVKPHAWLGSLTVAGCTGELDTAKGSFQTQVTITQDDIPRSRDPAWIAVEDLAACRQSLNESITLEFWDITAESLSFTDFRLTPGQE